MMNRMMLIALVMILTTSFLVTGCAGGDGGQIISGILQGIGQGLSGL